MATNLDPALLAYYRQYLDDPTSVNPGPTNQATGEPEPPDPNITYYRRYLVDPTTVG